MKQIEFPTAPNTQSHPWTGTSSGLISSLITLGELIRHHESIGPKPPRSTCTISDHEAAAAAIESRILLHCTYVRSTDVTQPEDGLSQLSYLSELYLIAILLQLYRVFPDLVQKHRESIYRTPRGFELFQGANREQNLYKIAEHILLLAIGGNQDPSVLRFELVPVIIACSELRLQAFRSDEISISISKDASEQHAGIIKVAQMRQLAKNHLFFMRSVFPGKRINQLANVISAMWVSLDNSMRAEDSFSWIKWLMLNGQDVI